ncbi:DUF58 domain-containing protein [Motilimonas sp. 1_MG-2023]|uniref:DUF58 domain-containing protein n=1 Tax=Motilimonas sp. 1_MG-2023 TaxID=3062672 RepID=UPI0026E162EB|nr:DUF58 domain-containing protein [Motilimonas sp. 1_MG-2023]MDO6526615.1 DUF58 domain-containing protein [Motilimonas sp. 1_MG-2023]
MEQTKSLQLLFVIFFVMGLVTTNVTLVAMSLFPLAYLLAAAATQRPVKLKVSRDVATSESHFTLSYQVENLASSLQLIYLKEAIPEALALNEQALNQANGTSVTMAAPLTQKRVFNHQHELVAKRGHFEFSDMEISVADFIGQVYHRENARDVQTVSKAPVAKHMGSIPLKSNKTFGFNGVVAAGKAGTGEAFFGLTQYQDQMSSRGINWRASAKHEELLLANEFEQDSNMNVGLIVDGRQHGHLHGSSELAKALATCLDNTLSLGLTMAKSLLNSGHRLGLLTLGQKMDYVYPNFGRRQLLKIEQALTKVEPSTGSEINLWALEHKPTMYFPNKANIVFISQLQPSDLPLLKGLKRAGYCITVIVPDPSGLVTGEHHEQIKALYHLARQSILDKFRQQGFYLINWQMEQSFNAFYHQKLLPALRLQRKMK